MKQILILIIPLFLFSCDQFCDEQNNKIALLETQLENTATDLQANKAELETAKASLNNCISLADSLGEKNAVLQFKLSVCKASENYQGSIIINQADSIQSLRAELNEINENYNDLQALHNSAISQNYMINKSTVSQKLNSINAEIETGEQAWFQLGTIATDTPETLEAVTAAKAETIKGLKYNYGQRDITGWFFNIQVESGQVSN